MAVLAKMRLRGHAASSIILHHMLCANAHRERDQIAWLKKNRMTSKETGAETGWRLCSSGIMQTNALVRKCKAFECMNQQFITQ